MIARLLLTVLLSSTAAAGLCQPEYKEVEWPVSARTAVDSPSPWHWGEVVGVATTARDTVLVLHRGAQPIMEFDVAGRFLRAWGEGLISEGKVTLVAPEHRAPGASGYAAVYGPAGCHACGAHSIRVDPRGNIWVADAGGHVVSKIDAQGSVVLQLGEEGTAGTDREHFNLPTDVAFAPGGEIYVSDGYGNARIVKFSSDGDYLLEWGSRGSGPGEFGLPHNLVTDASGRVYVTDRDNRRIQVFDAQGAIPGRMERNRAGFQSVHDRGSEDLDWRGVAESRWRQKWQGFPCRREVTARRSRNRVQSLSRNLAVRCKNSRANNNCVSSAVVPEG